MRYQVGIQVDERLYKRLQQEAKQDSGTLAQAGRKLMEMAVAIKDAGMFQPGYAIGGRKARR